jgi:uncharacterized membrane protein YphA (DoxX/SURF4 family)
MQAMSGWIYKLTRWILGGVFIYAGSTKLMEPRIFTVLIEAYGFVPEGLLIPVAIGLPLLEVIAGFGLLCFLWWYLVMVFGWGWMWTAAASALKIRKPRRFMV